MNNFDDLFEPQAEQTQDQPFDKEAWVERKQAERQDVYDLVDKATVEVSSDGNRYRDFLDVKSRLILYSATNTLLVLAQRPTATQLKDFDGWKKEGAAIKRGENHIKILEAGNSYKREDGSVGTIWNVKHVFDVSQTTVKPKEQVAPNYDDRQLLKALISKAPVPIQGVDDLPNGMGAYFDSQEKKIFVRRGMEAHDIFRSLSKELAHAEFAMSNQDYSRESAAFAAYSVSYVVSKRYGVNVNNYDFSRMPESFRDARPQDIRAVLNEVSETAKDITGRMNRALENTKAPRTKEQER